jgi:hypothetical protein
MDNKPGFNYGDVLSRAWQIMWKFKVLWIFGILAGCSQGSGGGNGGGNSNYEVGSRPGGDFPMPEWMRLLERNMNDFFNNVNEAQIALFVLGIICFVFILSIVFAAIGTVGKIGLIQGTVLADQGAESLGFGELFNSGKPFFLRVFGMNILIGLAALIIVGLPIGLFTLVTFGFGALCIIPLLCLLVPAAFVVSIVVEQANIALVTEDLPIMDALRRGWEVFKEDWGTFVIMGLILGIGIGLIVGFVLALPMFLVLMPILIGVLGDSSQSMNAGFITGGICFVIYLPILIVAQGIMYGYIQSAWTLTYLRVTGQDGIGPIEVKAIEPEAEEVVEEPEEPEDDPENTIIE